MDLKRRIYTITYVLITCAAIAGAWFYFLHTPVVTQPGGYTYYLKPGTAKQTAIDELSQQGIIKHRWLFALYIYPQQTAHLKTGEYLFRQGATLSSIWKQITTGTGLVYHPFTIIPGWSFKQVRRALETADGLRHLTKKMDDREIMTHMGNPDISPEGEFFPETYYYTRGNIDLVLLKRAYQLLQLRLAEAWEHRSQKLPYKTPYAALIAASLIEKEAYLNQERAMIGGVIVNRLGKDMLLQIDATVIYGMGDSYTGKIYKDDLLKDTAYNTYVHKGLPPTPIAMPGMASIVAALHPQQNDYFYYVAKGDGSHQFSKTLEQHNKAVDESNKLKKDFFNQSRVENYIFNFMLSDKSARNVECSLVGALRQPGCRATATRLAESANRATGRVYL